MEIDAVWASLRWPGLEHAVLSGSARGHRLDSLAVVVLEGQPYRISCHLAVDSRWRVRRLTASVSGPGTTAKARLGLAADGAGHWVDAATRRPIAALDGCLDVDVSTTPLTNTLPIRRLGLSPGMASDIRVVYIDAPDLTVTPAAQRYTCTGPEGAAPGYRYESGDFRADLRVDEHGVVLDYPGLWRRVLDS